MSIGAGGKGGLGKGAMAVAIDGARIATGAEAFAMAERGDMMEDV